MNGRLSVLPLGGCTLTIPLMQLHRRQRLSVVLSEIGFRHLPLALSAGSALQLIDIVRGKTPMPPPLLAILCYQDAALPSKFPDGAAERVATSDVCLMEISTPVEFEYEGYRLNRNRLRAFIFELAEGAGDRKPAAQWMNALQKENDALREKSAQALIAHLGGNPFACDIVARTRSRIASDAEIQANLDDIRAFLKGRMGIVLYNFRYMPDGRAIDWPQGFKDQVKAMAARLGIATYDPADLVARHGVRTAMAEESGHYAAEFNRTVAIAFKRFLNTLVEDRPLNQI